MSLKNKNLTATATITTTITNTIKYFTKKKYIKLP